MKQYNQYSPQAHLRCASPLSRERGEDVSQLTSG